MSEFNVTVEGGKAVRLKTAGKYCDRDIVVTASGGGGGSGSVDDDRVKYVTFIGLGGVELYRMPVISGDTCRDPVANKYIETPTKESDVQYTYTYSGWSLTEGGDASNSALTNVSVDRTVYVAFTATANKYTITYYDSDRITVLKTEEKPYGSIIGYIPEKKGYSFVGWQPTPDVVTGDASFIALWEENVTFERGSWEDIIEIAESGNAADYFDIGDTRTEYLNYTNGSAEEITLTIVGINIDTEKGITIASNVLKNTRQFKTSSDFGHWGNNCSLRTYLRDTIKTALPDTLQAGIKTVTRSFISAWAGGTTKNETIEDTLFLLSANEVYYSSTAYPYFLDTSGSANQSKRIGYKQDGTASGYYLRDATKYEPSAYRLTVNYVENDGLASTTTSNTFGGVRFGFCI